MAAKKSNPASARKAPAGKATDSVNTPVRNSAIPKPSAAAKAVELTHDVIAKRAYEIWSSGSGGTESDNWLRAEREQRGR